MKQAEGLEAVFECLYRGAVYRWRVNGIDLTLKEFPKEIRETGGTSGNPSLLIIPASSQFNNNVVQCTAIPSGAVAAVPSRNVTLKVGEFFIDKALL